MLRKYDNFDKCINYFQGFPVMAILKNISKSGLSNSEENGHRGVGLQ